MCVCVYVVRVCGGVGVCVRTRACVRVCVQVLKDVREQLFGMTYSQEKDFSQSSTGQVCVAVCCAVCCNVLQRVATCCGVLQYVVVLN